MVLPLANVTTMTGAILPATRRDMTIFCRYCVASCSLRVTKFHKLRLVSSKKSSMSQLRLKRQQTLVSAPDYRCVPTSIRLAR